MQSLPEFPLVDISGFQRYESMRKRFTSLPSPTPEEALANAEQVLDQITSHPETHDNGSWFGDGENSLVADANACGTTRCVAGWSAFFAGYRMTERPPLDDLFPGLRQRYLDAELDGLDPAAAGFDPEDYHRYAVLSTFPVAIAEPGADAYIPARGDDFELLGGALLGLGYTDIPTGDLFYADDEDAVKILSGHVAALRELVAAKSEPISEPISELLSG